MLHLKFHAHTEPDGDGGFIAKIPSLPQVFAPGDTPQEALENIADVARLVLEVMVFNGEVIPDDIPNDDGTILEFKINPQDLEGKTPDTLGEGAQ
ncbi:type II toxin-antitoxin system HicB family antitoxin [bacterium]|nr:type II toxin-antitoxin system HicB family antitoxin [bacterium]MBU1937899.1 type II toxin-antitoxin system HicB family antitoxin [bacterium]